MDAEANAVAEEENTEAMKTASRIDLKGAGYSQKDEVKSRGAKFDSNTKTWHITGEQYAQDENFWNGYAPVINTDCPF